VFPRWRTSLIYAVPAGRYARSLRLILRRARRAKVIPAPTVPSSPKHLNSDFTALTPSKEPTLPAFSPSQLVTSAYYPRPIQGNPALSPNSLLASTGQMINDSPSSATDLFEFDSLFAQETLERAGLKLGEGDQLPLYVTLVNLHVASKC